VELPSTNQKIVRTIWYFADRSEPGADLVPGAYSSSFAGLSGMSVGSYQSSRVMTQLRNNNLGGCSYGTANGRARRRVAGGHRADDGSARRSDSPASQRTLLGVVEICAAAKREKHQGEQEKPQIPHRVLHDGRYFAVWSGEWGCRSDRML
jgi:hypothetical protein